jgi:glucose-6-phosphate 1-epimerase
VSASPLPLEARAIDLDTADGAVPAIALRRGDDRATVALHGGHVLSWIPARGGERLYLSATTRYGAGASIRGGIPVIFPQFADRGPLPRHGLVRSRAWAYAGVDTDADGREAAVFVCEDDAASRARWPQAFALRLRVALEPDALHLGLCVHNRGATAFAFACALHSYLRVASLAGTRLDGLQGRPHRDRAHPDAGERIDPAPTPRFDGEIDRIYVGSDGAKRLHDDRHALRIETTGFTDTVVWNPGATLAAGMADLAPGDHAHFVCVEPACIEPPVALAPGARWLGTLRMTACD